MRPGLSLTGGQQRRLVLGRGGLKGKNPVESCIIIGTVLTMVFEEWSLGVCFSEGMKSIWVFCYCRFLLLFILFLAAWGLSCGTWDLSLRHTGVSLVVARGLQGAWAL